MMRRSLSILATTVLALVATPTWAVAAPAQTANRDGLIVRLGKLERLPSADAARCDDQGQCVPGGVPGLVLVRVNVVLGLPSSAPRPIDLDVVAGSAAGIALLTGADRHVAAIDCGYVGEAHVLCTDNGGQVPTHVAPGAEVTLSESFDVPVDALGKLTVTVQPPVSNSTGTNPLPATTFPNAQERLTG
jgi:hypothetical protein